MTDRPQPVGSWRWASAGLVVMFAIGACSNTDPSSAPSDSSVDSLDTTSVPNPTLTADGSDASTTDLTTEATPTTATPTTPTTPGTDGNPIPGCEPGDAKVDPLDAALPAEMEQARQHILEAHAACDLDQLLALTDPSALISDPGDNDVLVLNFGDQEPIGFANLPFDVIPKLLNGPWKLTQADYGGEVADFSNGSHQLHISSQGRWTAFLIVVS